MAARFTEEEFEHWFLPRDGIIDSFVNEVRMFFPIILQSSVTTLASTNRVSLAYLVSLQVDGKVTDFISFYALPSTIMHHPTHKTLNAAYAFYMAANKVSRTQLMTDALIMAKQVSFYIS